jgi:hypothetical protein
VVGQSVCRHIHIPPNNKQQKPTNKTNKQQLNYKQTNNQSNDKQTTKAMNQPQNHHTVPCASDKQTTKQ